MFFDLKLWTIADNIETFEVVSKKYFEVSVVSIVMKCGVNVVIVSTSIGGIFYFKIFHKYKIFDYLNIFYLSVL